MNLTVEVNFRTTCKLCQRALQGKTLKRMYFWLTIHLKYFCKHSKNSDFAALPVLLWQLWRLKLYSGDLTCDDKE